MSMQNDSHRIFLRGETAKFVVNFYEDASQTIPLIPIDSAKYPFYTIYDINNELIQSGVGIAEITIGRYRAEYLIPFDAPLSNDRSRWRIEWTMISTDNRQVDFVEEYDIKDTVITASETREQKFITLVGNPYRTILRLPTRPHEVALDVYRANNLNQKVVDNVTTTFSDGVKMSPDGDSIVYYYDIAADLINRGCGLNYAIIWKIRNNFADPQEFIYQNLTIITPKTLLMITCLRMLIDKLQKRLGIVQAYEDSDIVEYLARGAELVNSVYPTTFFSSNMMPNSLTVHHLLFSGWYALQAQGLLATELAFSFCVDENTLLPTENGLTRAKNLIEVSNYRYEIAKKIVGDRMPILEELAISEFHNPVHISNIVKCLKIDATTEQLKSLFGRLQIKDRKIDPKSTCTTTATKSTCTTTATVNYIWDMQGIGPELQTKFFNNVFEPTSLKLLTPYGYETPKTIYKFENRKCLEVSTALGYPVVATYNHPFLVLNTNTFEMEWKRADELQKGDLIAINKNIPETAGTTCIKKYTELVDELALQYPDESILPTTLTKELARLLGYLISEEGSVTSENSIIFSNSNMNIVKDYLYCINTCFPNIKSTVSESENKAGYGNLDTKKLMHIVKSHSVRIRRFLYCLGLEYVKATKKTIPEVILTAPLDMAAEFLKAFVGGDGCYSSHKREDNSELQACIFSSYSKSLLVDIQMLLLRYGIISSLQWGDNNRCVRISGKSLSEYVKKIGFLFKGAPYNYDKTCFTPLRESMPELYYALKNNVRPLLGLNAKGWKDHKRYKIYWNHNAKAYVNIRWEHIDKWWADSQEAIKELNPEVYNRLKAFADSKFLWKPVKEVVDAGFRTVIDPSFETHDRLLDHAFQTGGIITHNSGQTVTLEHDQSSGLAELAGRWQDFLNTNLPPAKMAIIRRNNPVGTVAGRQYRLTDINLFTFKTSSLQGGTNQILSQMTTLGLLF